ncbi:hypothetical protein T484DRAFT_1609228, partial [Baffinella frigidus]
PQPQTPNPKPQTPSPKPQTPNPKPPIPLNHKSSTPTFTSRRVPRSSRSWMGGGRRVRERASGHATAPLISKKRSLLILVDRHNLF